MKMALPEQQLKRFLHFGKEQPFYQPGDRNTNAVYQPNELQSVIDLIALDKQADVANLIVKAYSDGYSPYPNLLVYALAICARQQTSQQLREAAYNAVKTVCATTENLFLFIKYCTKLAAPHSMWGSGSRRVLKDWYLKIDVKELAKIISKNKSLHGWTHKDVLKMIHVKTDEPARAAIFMYAMFDLKTAKEKYSEFPDAQEVLSYLQTVEDVRHSTDAEQVALAVEKHHLSLEHIPSNLLKSKEVWAAIIPSLPLSVIINSLQRIGYLGLLKPNTIVSSKVYEMITNETAIAESHLHPAQVYVALKNYEMSSKYVAAVAAQKKKQLTNGGGEGDGVCGGETASTPKSLIKAPPSPNINIISGLHELYKSTCKLFLPATGMRYLVSIDVKNMTPTEKCFRSPHVSPAQAAVLTALCLMQADRDVTVVHSEQNGEVLPLGLEATMTVEQGVKKLAEFHSQHRRITSALPITYCLTNNIAVDVFVVISDGMFKSINQTVSLLNDYRAKMNLPNTKFIMNLVRTHTEVVLASESRDPGFLDIGGFDGNVPKIIEAFSRGAF